MKIRDKVWIEILSNEQISRRDLAEQAGVCVSTAQDVLHVAIDNDIVQVESRNPLVVSRGDDEC